MADQAEGTSVAAPLSASDLRSQILSSIPEEAEKPADPEPEAATEESADPAEDEATEEAEPAEDDADDGDGDEDDSPKEETTDDPKALKGLDVVRRAEKRHREKMDADRAEFAREREKHAEALTKVQGQPSRVQVLRVRSRDNRYRSPSDAWIADRASRVA